MSLTLTLRLGSGSEGRLLSKERAARDEGTPARKRLHREVWGSEGH